VPRERGRRLNSTDIATPEIARSSRGLPQISFSFASFVQLFLPMAIFLTSYLDEMFHTLRIVQRRYHSRNAMSALFTSGFWYGGN
jgi:hypothetical protein